ncbi:MAG TPA: cob(I)yrinic acid a,c-diamide adenosyltransferase [Polyangiaceae bacterium]|jgi:cob(I)alamin adenosyltransferase|nr:cob(I)yrinic acid a,c-diamide adenosyltransferase [Polyangiaceae bacterium]
MKIYTRTGDRGQTGLFGGARLDKDDARVEAYGTVDELNATLGVARAEGLSRDVDAALATIQDDLLRLGAELATAPGKEHLLTLARIDGSDATRLETFIDESEGLLPALSNFILPGGSKAAASLHHARTVCRRAERRVISAYRGSSTGAEIVIYLNRLSDLLFVFARRANQEAGESDVQWQGRGR